MAFMLVIVLEGKTMPEEFLFRDANRCRQFEAIIEKRQKKLTAYCLPKWVSSKSKFND